MKNLEMMKQYLRDHNLTSQVREFTQIGTSSEDAIEYVYDVHTLTKEEFVAKYFGEMNTAKKYLVVKDGDVVFAGSESQCVEMIEKDMTGMLEMYPETAMACV